ncbi:TetR/AcrR family transcriptional regulator C-terminal domain-containing protein [Amycolatopsis sp. DG1A-15b]|uniref:TetR/AcrR family transcriptional regulator C-terminal domain-containing protein n=1 Tax=Amycolatopsis sp. DG1A-15b TaxID=3052846 RepID=UPI00255BC87D|nr:TetR/AcrR family transcriptional regulator C-terminal domain-containing protein [Amycolatopsis sp. DG1A-15b]WIX92178.1 TetR/AcrR family transcriptional regulator C-terminal domain-containing protein [Amycolatopsis sp. DG1A-15b]
MSLTREKILDAALRLADEQGMAALSMRKVAAAVGVEAMSLYNHVENKGDLLDGLTARVFEEVALPDPALPWDDRLRSLAEDLYASFVRHPVVVRALAAQDANPRSAGALRVIDALLRALLDAGLTEEAAARSYRSLLGMLFGSVLTRTTGPGAKAARAEPVVAYFRRMVAAGELPSLQRVLPALESGDCVQDFEYQLELLIGGLAPVRG